MPYSIVRYSGPVEVGEALPLEAAEAVSAVARSAEWQTALCLWCLGLPYSEERTVEKSESPEGPDTCNCTGIWP